MSDEKRVADIEERRKKFVETLSAPIHQRNRSAIIKFRANAPTDIEYLLADNTRLREALEKTPSVKALDEWVNWVNGPLITQQARGHPLQMISADVQEVRNWITYVCDGGHQTALTPPEPSKKAT